jgi:phosphoribosylformylglycinamidine (FGAM) synthase-like enzyme
MFSESCGRFVVTTAETDASAFAERLRGLPCRRVGRVTEEPRLRVRCGSRSILDNELAALKASYKETLSDV